VIIGNSAAGIAAAREVRQHDPAGEVTILSDEPAYGYSRVLLPLYIAKTLQKRELLIADREFYASRRIRLRRGEAADGLDPVAQRLTTRSGRALPYDRLLIATGSSPRRLELPGGRLPGIHYLRRLEDAEAIRRDLASSREPILVYGGGPIGVKSLQAFLGRKRPIHLVISSGRILSQMLDDAASALFVRAFRAQGIFVHLGTDVEAFLGQDRLEGARLSDGRVLPCALAVIGKGVAPNIDFLRGTDIRLNRGIVVDSGMATSLPGVYAAGDVAETVDLLRGQHRENPTWPLSAEGGRVAGTNMAAVPCALPGGLRMNSAEVLGVRAISVGDLDGDRVQAYAPKGAAVYRKLVFSGARLTGFILAGDIAGAGILTATIKAGADIPSAALEEGLVRGFSFAPRLQRLAGEVRATLSGC
jgi:NAD(P)H-nitrite reductase large subunit